MTNAQDNLEVRILTPRGLLYSGHCSSVSSENSAGKFDILPKHGNFISIIDAKPIIVRDLANSEHKFIFPLAVIRVFQNLVNVYTQLR